MSDSGRIIGDCRHGTRPESCVPCLREKADGLNRRLVAFEEMHDELVAALRGLLPEDWGDGTMDHMPGVLAAREALERAKTM